MNMIGLAGDSARTW